MVRYFDVLVRHIIGKTLVSTHDECLKTLFVASFTLSVFRTFHITNLVQDTPVHTIMD